MYAEETAHDAPTPDGQVSDRITQLEKLAKQQAEVVFRLSDRLAPVLRVEPEQATNAHAPGPMPVLVPMAERLTSLAELYGQTFRRLTYLADAIEL